MSQVTVKAWKCDREVCGHVWLSEGDEPPVACARCKSRSWNKGEIEVKREKRKVVKSVPDVVIKATSGLAACPIHGEGCGFKKDTGWWCSKMGRYQQ